MPKWLELARKMKIWKSISITFHSIEIQISWTSFSHCWNKTSLLLGDWANILLICQINPVVDRPTTIQRRTQNTQHRTQNKGGGWTGLWRALSFVCCISAAFGLSWNFSVPWLAHSDFQITWLVYELWQIDTVVVFSNLSIPLIACYNRATQSSW